LKKSWSASVRVPPRSPLTPPVGDPTPWALDAVETILTLLGAAPGETTLIALGPLTNLALALRRDPGAFSRVREIVIMGGAVAAPGNVTPTAEFNFFVDPEAAHEVLTSNLPVTLVPLDVTRKAVLRAMAIRELGRSGGEVGRFVEVFSREALDFAGRVEREDGITLHDPLAVAVAIAADLFTFESFSLDVETHGDDAGTVHARRSPSPGRPHGCRVATDVRAKEFLDLFLERLCRGSSSSAAPI